ncbi:MAG: hypothetical protein JO250_13885 [Armatimonadetes bacterium]|nr:hypothetical protein [Armatimonadota bacterium]
MATKTAEKKTTKKAAAPTPAAAADPVETLAGEVLLTFLHRVLVRLGEPARVPEIVREIGDEAISAPLARRAMETHPRRFVAVDRRWDIAQRYLDRQRPQERTLEEVVAAYGAPLPLANAAGELAHVYGRPREHFEEVAPRLLRGPRFFPVAEGLAYGLRAWLLDTSTEREDDVLFYNYLSADTVAAFAPVVQGADWEADPLAAAHALVAAGGGLPMDNRLIQFFAWRALGEDFDPVALYDQMHAQSDILLALPDHRWLPSDALEPLRAVWRAQASQVAELAPEEPAAEIAPAAPAKPLELTEEDLEEIAGYFEGREEAVSVPALLTNVLELPASAGTFAQDAQTLTQALRARPDQFLWVGTDRFRAPDTLPPYIGQVPESLTFPALPRFETADGEILDQMLTDAAFEDDLKEAILDPVAQDVNDQEPGDRTRWPEGQTADAQRLRLVLKAHHKEIGTFPLAQIPFGFFPTEPNIVELTLRDAAGNAYPIYVDYDVQLVYGLFDVYADIAADSGAVFHLERTDNPAEYRFVQANETDPGVFVSDARLGEMLDFRAEVESGPVSTYDIIRRILDHYRKGASFLTLLTEVNLVRRTPRRLIASILSGYLAFHPRANRWTFDAKREPEGFDRSKTGYIVR